MVVPETRYARSGDVHIGYQVVGEGPPDLLLVPEFWHSIEAQWDEPALAAFLQRLSSFGRLISFDQRGTGISDPVPPDGVLALEPIEGDREDASFQAGADFVVHEHPITNERLSNGAYVKI